MRNSIRRAIGRYRKYTRYITYITSFPTININNTPYCTYLPCLIILSIVRANPTTIMSNPYHAKNGSYARTGDSYLTKRSHCSLAVLEKWHLHLIFNVNKYRECLFSRRGLHVCNQFSRISTILVKLLKNFPCFRFSKTLQIIRERRSFLSLYRPQT